ncbi:hypothetical protein CsSME_00000710 [Camellia sinensis var. sinensis]
MGPIRGLKRKRKIEKEVDQNAALSSLPYQPESLDWWDHFSKRITDKRNIFVFYHFSKRFTEHCYIHRSWICPNYPNLYMPVV